MLALLVRRLLGGLVVLGFVTLVAFMMFRFVGDPVNQMVGIETTPEQRIALRNSLGLDDPVPVQFARYVGSVVRFDLGLSYQTRTPVVDLFAERLPATIELALVSVVIAIVVGIPLGVLTGVYPDSLVSRLLMAVSLAGISLPTFLIGILLIYVFSVQLQVLPSFGRGEVVDLGGWSTGLLTTSGLKALLMPALTLALFQLTLIMRLVRSEMMDVLRADFIRFARARGISEFSIHFKHALRNTLVPVITVIGLQFGSIIAFAVVTEHVFQWPGMGQLFLQAINTVDIPVMSAYLLFVATLFLFVNLIVDLLYSAIDPRIRLATIVRR